MIILQPNHIHFANAVVRNDHSMYMLPTSASIGKQRTMHKSQHDTTGTNVTRMSNAQPNSQPNPGKRADKISQRIPAEYVENVHVHTNTVLTATPATHYYLNPNIPEVHHILNIYKELMDLTQRQRCATEEQEQSRNLDFEIWHMQLIAGLVILISYSRFLSLKTWSDFAESSEASNQLVLTSLEPLDYAFVAFLPDIIAALFGILRLGSGQKFSFAIWATFVGLAYGYATILTSSLIIPMASHVINNLIGGVIWHINHQKRESSLYTTWAKLQDKSIMGAKLSSRGSTSVAGMYQTLSYMSKLSSRGNVCDIRTSFISHQYTSSDRDSVAPCLLRGLATPDWLLLAS
ncbi:hypothetical protein Tco_0821668 [Tanacetum coccineum]|uniref:CAAX prenyl protease 2/Lysostaphin resistance protein A-like domain-containing protein n=1 Tax=Tanacetum coccineum TaxID=301880 RepID=A0ABQ5AEN9_9ASTR